ncbi:MAG: type II secretion system protein GspD [Limisphaerales bacterium]
MKIKLATLLVAAVSLWGPGGFAQNQGQAPDAPQPAATEATDLAKNAAPESAEVEPLIQFDDADLNAAIKTLARQANINVMFDEKMSAPGPDGKTPPPRKISDRFSNVTAQEALDALLDNYHLQMIPDPKVTKAKIYRIASKDANALEPLTTKVIELRYASPTNVLELIRTAFGNTNRSRVIPDTRTSQIVVVATQNEMDAVEKLITKIDTATKQVLIEARLLETAQNPHSMRGIDWSGTLLGQNVAFGNGASGGQTTTTIPGTPTTTTQPSGRVTTATPGSSTSTTISSLFGSNPTLGTAAAGFTLDTLRGIQPEMAFLNADGVRAVLSALNQESDTEVIATPRAVTLDNQSAVLSVTKAFPIFQQTPGSPNTPATSTIVYTNVGTILTVTPRISGGTNVALKVVPEVSTIDVKDSQIINGQPNEANVFAFRKIEANVMIPSGNTLVMGGLISDSTTKAYTKVPVLGDLPIIGLAFRHEDKQRSKQNLIIFITPTVIQASDFQPTTTHFLKEKIPLDYLDNDVKPGLGTRKKLKKGQPLLEQ